MEIYVSIGSAAGVSIGSDTDDVSFSGFLPHPIQVAMHTPTDKVTRSARMLPTFCKELFPDVFISRSLLLTLCGPRFYSGDELGCRTHVTCVME